MYELICKGRFDKLETMHQETIDILRGKNGNPGLLDDVRKVTQSHKRVVGIIIFAGGAIALQLIGVGIEWIKALVT